MNLEWAHVVIGLVGMVAGGAGGIFGGGWRLGRIEGRLKLSFQASISACEQKFEDKMDLATVAFDETLKGLRQKINDVELETERGFVKKEGFDEFRKEYREDMRLVFEKLDRLPRTKQ